MSGLVSTAVLNTKIGDTKDKYWYYTKYFTTADYNKLTGEILEAKINQKEFVNESDISNLVKS